MSLLNLHSFLIWIIFTISFSSFFIVSIFGYKLSSSGSLLLVCINSLFIFTISVYFFYMSFSSFNGIDYSIGSWFSMDLVNIYYGVRVDQLTATMLVVITTISLFAQLYSIEYMFFDTHKTKFFSYLALFTFFMLILVCSNNLFFVFIGWEGVGICSYLLINFWYFRIQSNKASILAVTVNKIGDLSFLIAISIIHSLTKSNDLLVFNNISMYIHKICGKSQFYVFLLSHLIDIDGLFSLLSSSTLFFIIACVGKSAQLGLHLWLPEAMEGPTPVSSLIHAATMVTAGIYLILRVSYLFQFSPTSLVVILLVGSTTTLFASSIGLLQVDIKKIVAYSTCSQLGYMFMGCGYKGYHFVIFHLFVHAFFKALLFLTAGYIIHLLVNEQDTRKMGGLIKLAQLSYMASSIGSLALIGFPFFSGFYSKEKILEELNLMVFLFAKEPSNYESLVLVASLLSYTTLILTIVYSFKVLSEIYFGGFNGFKSILSYLSYSEYFMITPIFLLSILSIYSGFIFSEAMIGVGTDFWFNSFLVEDRTFFDSDIAIPFTSEPLSTFMVASLYTMLDICYCFEYTSSSNTLFYVNWISELEWIHSQWVVPFWTFYYLWCIAFLRFSFLLETRYYLFRIMLGNVYWFYFYTSLFNKYTYINRVIIVPLVIFSYYISYNYFYRIVEKGFLEQVSGFGLFELIRRLQTARVNKQTFLIYHYLGLIIISLFVVFFISISYI